MPESGMSLSEMAAVLSLWNIPSRILTTNDCNCWEYCEHELHILEAEIEEHSIYLVPPYHPDSGPNHQFEDFFLAAEITSRLNPHYIVADWGAKRMACNVRVADNSIVDELNGREEPNYLRVHISLSHSLVNEVRGKNLVTQIGRFLTEFILLLSYESERFYAPDNWAFQNDEEIDIDEIRNYLDDLGMSDTESLANISSGTLYSTLYELFSKPDVYERVNTTPSSWQLILGRDFNA